MKIKKYLEAIIAEHEKIGYSFPQSLNPPAKAEEILDIETKLGFQLTDDIKELYLFANGAKDVSHPVNNELIPLHRFLSLASAHKYYEENVKNKYVFDELFVNWESNEAPGEKLFPFIADDNHCYWIDLNTNTKNEGRLYAAYYGGESPRYEFKSLPIFLEAVLQGYTMGAFYTNERGFLETKFAEYADICKKLNPDILYWQEMAKTWRELNDNNY